MNAKNISNLSLREKGDASDRHPRKDLLNHKFFCDRLNISLNFHHVNPLRETCEINYL